MLRIHSLALIIMGCLLVLIATPSHIFARPLRVGYFKVAPHAMPGPQGTPQGVAVEYFKFIAQEMQLDEIEFIMLPLGRLLLDLENNRIDMALLLARKRRLVLLEQDAEVLRVTAACTAILERWVRAHPEIWLWMHRRWKTAPPTEQAKLPRAPGAGADRPGPPVGFIATARSSGRFRASR